MYRLIGLALLATLLSGCESSSGSDNANDTNIRAFTLTGTDGVTSAPTIFPSVSATENGGVFSVDWDVTTATRPYVAEVYLSVDGILDIPGDVRLMRRNCDSGSGNCPDQVASFDCTYDASVTITCAPGAAADINDLSGFFPALPGRYSLILRACNAFDELCLSRRLEVDFE